MRWTRFFDRKSKMKGIFLTLSLFAWASSAYAEIKEKDLRQVVRQEIQAVVSPTTEELKALRQEVTAIKV